MTLQEFIKSFRERKGSSVFLAMFIEKIVGFVLVIIATNFLVVEEYGAITYATSILTFVLPFIGLGLHQGLIRFGSITGSQQEKKYLFNIALKRGVIYSSILWILLLSIVPIISTNIEDSAVFLSILSFQVLSLYLLGIVKIYARIIQRNKLFSKITIINSLVIVLSAFVLTILFGSIGFVLALAVSPFIVSIVFIHSLKLRNYNKSISTQFTIREFIVYGLNISIANVVSQLLYAVDIILIANLIKDEVAIAQYKVANVLPYSLLFIPIVVMTSDFVVLARESTKNSVYLQNYYKNYLKVFSLIVVVVVLFFWFFDDLIYNLFGQEYQPEDNLMFVFAVGIAGALLLRVPLGNITSAMGKAKINLWVSIATLIFNLVLSYNLLIKFGVLGVAVATASSMWFSGILYFVFFRSNLKKQNTV